MRIYELICKKKKIKIINLKEILKVQYNFLKLVLEKKILY